MLKGKNIFITGGAGFIGVSLCEALIEQNRITIFDNFHRDALKFTTLQKHSNLQVIEGDILDSSKLKRCLKGFDIVVHLAAIAGVWTVVNHPAKTLKVNLIGTYNLLEAVKDLGLERFVNFSTSEVYGPFIFKGDEKIMTTQGAIGEPRWVYSVSKITGEHLGYSYFREYNLPFVSIRPFNIYGPKQVGEGAIHHFIVSALQNKDLIVHNDGNQVRSWCYVDDLIVGTCLACTEKKAVGNVFNIGNPKATSTTLALAEKIISYADSSSKIRFKTIDYPDVEIRIPSIDKAMGYLGYGPGIDLNEGIKKTIKWYKLNWKKLDSKDKSLL
ncbi:MAG TPA: NAD-dependent epimerase/dehydratase family protein [candidate division Zixibacteria bacterium]|jgi:dTDP-glucose 4,6-dehydratase